jgi:putative bacteriocin precursor
MKNLGRKQKFERMTVDAYCSCGCSCSCTCGCSCSCAEHVPYAAPGNAANYGYSSWLSQGPSASRAAAGSMNAAYGIG